MAIEFDPMRSIIYADCVNEKYRVKMKYWLYNTHVPESISQFQPYVTKYAFYDALPVPAEGKRFGVYNNQMTEHYWLFNPLCPELKIKALEESIDIDVLKGQGNIPDIDGLDLETLFSQGADSADAIRGNTGENDILVPFIQAFVPVAWQEEYKGAHRKITDGPNYRWQFFVNYPEGCDEKTGEEWLTQEVLPAFAKMPQVNRILSSKVRKEINNSPYSRICEIWFDSEIEWRECAVEGTKEFVKPAWAKYDEFPFMKPKYEFASIFLSDFPASDNYSAYHGLHTMR